jgi:hypothetical protein
MNSPKARPILEVSLKWLLKISNYKNQKIHPAKIAMILTIA